VKWASAFIKGASKGLARCATSVTRTEARAAQRLAVPAWEETQLVTARCLVRPALPDDAHVLFEASSHAAFNRWLTWDRPRSVAAIEERFAQQLRAWRTGTAHCFSVVDRATGLVFAGADLKPDAFEVHPGTRNLGYWTHPALQGQGYASEFVPAVVSWAFASAGVGRLVGGVAPQNVASHRILQRLGFAPFETRLVGKPGRKFENVRYFKLRPSSSAAADPSSAAARRGDPKPER
jgi:[ribosomal protein S5]-alanine N-acetyltransferase